MRLSDLTSTRSFNLSIAPSALEVDLPQAVEVAFLDAAGEVADKQTVVMDGELELDPEMLRKTDRIAILPEGTELTAETREVALQVSPDQLLGMIGNDERIVLSPDRLTPLIPFIRCLDGSVRKCWWWPFFHSAFNQRISQVRELARPQLPLGDRLQQSATRFSPFDTLILPPIQRCRPVCIGRIEVFRRRCCRRVILVPNDIFEICERLKRIPEFVPNLPPIPPVPPIIPELPEPGPDPFPFEEADIFTGGTVDEVRVNAAADLAFLQSAPFEEQREFVLARPHLLRWLEDCSDPVQVAEGQVGPDGEFSICFREFPILLPVGCHLEYAFRIYQPTEDGEGEFVIYDGVAANAWFESGDPIELTTYNPAAIDCDDPDPRLLGEDVFLDLIGQTDAWHLDRIAQNGPESTLPLSPTTGLAGNVGDIDLPRNLSESSNWGGNLQIRYLFPDPLRTAGAHFYRMAISRISNTGTPIATSRRYLSEPITWSYYNRPTNSIEQETLNDPSNPTFYRIPYSDPNRVWRGVQIHNLIRTASIATHGKFLLTLELYDSARNRLVPTGSGGQVAGDVQAGFTYAWVERPGTGPLPKVPFAALSHVIWWDNRRATAEIVATTLNGMANTDECQFLEAPGGTAFGAQIRAFHPVEMFLQSWDLDWQRGLNGGNGHIDEGTGNVGDGMTPHTTMGTVAVADMLGPVHERCAFSLELDVITKTWNGIGHVSTTDNEARASFALGLPVPATP